MVQPPDPWERRERAVQRSNPGRPFPEASSFSRRRWAAPSDCFSIREYPWTIPDQSLGPARQCGQEFTRLARLAASELSRSLQFTSSAKAANLFNRFDSLAVADERN